MYSMADLARMLADALRVAAIAIIGFARGISAAERSHFIEYTVLALIVHEALLERRDQGRRVPVPAVLAIVRPTLAGVSTRVGRCGGPGGVAPS